MRLLIFFIVVIFTSCSPLKNLSPSTYSIEHLDKKEFSRLNGTYSNVQDTVFGKIFHYPGRGRNENDLILLDRLFIFFPDQSYDKGTTVELIFTSKRNANITAWQSGSMVFTKEIRGRFKKGYFYLRPKIFIVPFFPVCYWHNFERVRIGKSGNNLIVDHTIKSWGFALFAGGSDNGRTTSFYSNVSQAR